VVFRLMNCNYPTWKSFTTYARVEWKPLHVDTRGWREFRVCNNYSEHCIGEYSKTCPCDHLYSETTSIQGTTCSWLYHHCIALHCIALHYITLQCITLHYITLQCIALHYITLHYMYAGYLMHSRKKVLVPWLWPVAVHWSMSYSMRAQVAQSHFHNGTAVMLVEQNSKQWRHRGHSVKGPWFSPVRTPAAMVWRFHCRILGQAWGWYHLEHYSTTLELCKSLVR
jgi:hypothetical protein